MSVKSSVGRKAATSVVKHSVHGTVSKAKRNPVRATRLLGLGALFGAAAGFLAGRRTAPTVAPVVHAAPTPPPVPAGHATPPPVPPKPAKPKPRPQVDPETTAAAASAVEAAAKAREAEGEGDAGEQPLPPPD